MRDIWGRSWSGAAVFALLVVGLLAAFPWFEATRNANELPRMMQARALVEEGRWDLSANSVSSIPVGPDLAEGVEGRVYPNKPPGSSIVLSAAYLSARGVDAVVDRPFTLRDYGWWSRLFIGVIPTLLVCAFAWRRYRRDLGPPAVSAGIFAWVFATPAFAYAHLAYGHALTAALLFVGICKLADGHREETPVDTFVGALLAGAAVTVEYGAVFAALPIGVMLLLGVREGDRGLIRCGVGLGGALLPIAGLAAYQSAAFGSWRSTGYHHVIDPGFAQKHGQGFLGLGTPSWERAWTDWFAQDTGLLWWSPIVLVGIFGLVQLARSGHERNIEARLMLGTIVVLALVGSGLSFEGGWRVGPRYLVFTLPGVLLGVAYVFNQVRMNDLFVGVFVAVLGYAMIMNVLAGTLWPHVDPENLNSPFGELLWPLLKGGAHPYGIFDLFAGAEGELAPAMLGWGLSLGVPLAGLLLITIYGSDFTSVTAWSIALGLLVASVACFSAAALVEVHPKGERNLDYVRSVYEPSLGTERRALPSRTLPTGGY